MGESKEINVPIGKGYSALNAPTPELVNRELIFNVFIHKVISNVNGDDSDSSSGLFNTIPFTNWDVNLFGFSHF